MVSKGEEDNMASLPATHELHIFGSINGVDFDMVGQGTGNPNDGYEELNLKSTKGDLQFSPWILVPHIGYGFHQYLPYPDGMSPFQAAMVDGSGYQVHRTMQFEDGASLTVNYRYTYEGSHIKGEAQVKGTGFPADGPVMTNSLTAADWCRSKKTYPNDKTIISTFKWSYTTGNGKRYRSTARTTYTFAKPMAANYLKNQPMYVFRKTELKHSKTELNFKEWQKAFTDVMGMDELYKLQKIVAPVKQTLNFDLLKLAGDVESNPGPLALPDATMKTFNISQQDLELVEVATEKITMLYEDNKHHVGAAIRTKTGEIISAVHIEAYIGRVTVCAEAIAIGSAVSNGQKDFDTIVAVRHPYSDEVDRSIRVVSPCGMCRELISDYAPDCFVLIEMNGKLVKTTIEELIPLKYTRN